MKKILFCVLIMAIAAACERDFLNTKPLDKVSSADAWKDGALAEAFVTGIYAGLGQGGFVGQMLASLSDVECDGLLPQVLLFKVSTWMQAILMMRRKVSGLAERRLHSPKKWSCVRDCGLAGAT